MGRLLEDTKDVEDLATFFRLASPIANDLAGYAMTHLGRFASPIMDGLTVVARAGSLMSDQQDQPLQTAYQYVHQLLAATSDQ